MTISKNYCDCYDKQFDNYDKLIAEVNAFEKGTEWIPGIVSKGIKIESLEPIESAIIEKERGIPAEIAQDTGENTKLMMVYDKNTYMLRDTAIATILETAKVSGSSLGRMPAYLLAEVLNRCLSVARGESLLLFRGEKVCACLSDGYKVMPISKLLRITIDGLNEKFGEVQFVEGENNYTLTTALWELPDAQDKLLKEYGKAVPQHKNRLHGRNFMPAVRFITSDVGKCAATLIPVFRMQNGAYFRINDGIKVAHKGNGGLETYEDKLSGIYSKFCDTAKTLAAMSKCVIDHPLNALVGMCKKAGIPKKFASEAYEEINIFCNDNPCYMDDIYLSIAAITASAKHSGLSGSKLLELEDAIAKILYYDWSAFDLAGVVAW